jgi:hypothetical protein
MGGVQVVELLRMMAQDVRDDIAAEALQALGTIRLPEAARALQTLIPVSAPELRPLVERLLRKQRFAGVEVRPLSPPEPEWRALVGAMDGLGQQNVWFLQGDAGTGIVQFLNVLLNDRAGAVEAVGHAQVPALMLPPRQPAGYIHDVALPDGSSAQLMLETDFDVGRRLVLEALTYNRETKIPVAGPLRLLSPWLWGYSGADALPPRTLPQRPTKDPTLTGHLLGHPAFATWTIRSQVIFQAAEEALRHPGWNLEVWVRRLAGDLFSQPAVAQVFRRRLVAMGEWLLLAGEEESAQLALAAADALLQENPQDQSFVQALVRRDLQLALYGLKQMPEPVSGTA